MTVYYVRSVNGNDGNAGTSFAAAFQTVQQGLDSVSAGDQLHLCDEGTISISTMLETAVGGTNSNYIDVRAASGTDGTFDGSDSIILQASSSITSILNIGNNAHDYYRWYGIHFDGNSNSTNCIRNTVDSPTSHNFSSCKIQNASGHGISTRGTGGPQTGITYNDCEISNNGSWGHFPAAGARSGVGFENCLIHDNSSGGVTVYQQRSRFISCQIYDNGGDGIQANATADRLMISNCTIFGNDGDGIQRANGAIQDYIINTTMVSNGAYGLNVGSGGESFVHNWNHYHNNTSGDSNATLVGINNQSGDPKFVSTTDGSEDFRPLPGSPLISNGCGGSTIGALAQHPGTRSTSG